MKKGQQVLLPIFLCLITVLYFLQGFSFRYVFGKIDMLTVYLPNRDYVFDVLKEGSVPLWCDELALGFPVIAEGHVAFFYPLNIICLFLPLTLAVNIFLIFHYFLAGYFTYLYCKEIRLGNSSSIFAGLIFAFGGYLTEHSIHLNIVTTVSWFPLILLFVEKGLKNNNSKYFILAGLAMGVQTLAYFPQISLYTAMAIFLYSVVRCSVFKNYKFAGIFIIFITTFLLSSLQIFPAYELAKNSVRAEGVDDFFRGTFPPEYLKYIFFPNYQEKVKYMSSCPDEYYMYIGIIPLIAVLFTFLKKNKYKYLFYILLLLPFLYSLKDIHKLFYSVPVLNFFAAPARFLFLSAFSLSVLCGIGIGYFKSNKLKMLIIILTVFDLYIFNVEKNVFYVAKKDYLPPKEVISYLKKDKNNFRICTNATHYSEIGPNINLHYDLSTVNILTPLMLERWWNFFSRYVEKGDKRILDLSNVKYLISREKIVHPDISLVFQNRDNIKIYRNKTSINTYAFVVHNHKKAKNKDEALKLFSNKNFNFRDTVIIEDNIKFKGKNKMFVNNRFSVFDRKGFKVFMNSPGYLVLSQSFYPGWKAYINGKETKIYPANYALQAVYLPKGENVIDFVYEPLSFKVGWVLSIFSAAVVMAVLGLRWTSK